MHKAGLGQWIKRIALGLLGLLLLVVLGLWFFLRGSLAQLDGRRTVPGLQADVSIARDDRGVPTISGTDRQDVAYATGFVHAQDRFFQMDLLRRSAAGELAELFGPRAVPVDRDHRLHRFRALAEQALISMPAADRKLLDRYVVGVNDGLNHLGTRPFEYGLIGVGPRAWSAADSLLVIWAMYFDLQGGQEARELARGWLREQGTPEQLAVLLPEASQWDAPLDAAAVPAPVTPFPDKAPAWWGRAAPAGAPKVASAEFADMVGSNNWAVAGSRSKDGAAIVSDDMHLGIQLPNTWYRAVLQIPDGHGATRRVVGVTLPGAPAVVVGSNGHVAWGFTNSYGDYLDLVMLGTDAGKPGQVRTPAGWETPAAHDETILVKGAPDEHLTVKVSSLGPLREAGGRTYAIHWIAHEREAVDVRLRQLEAASTLDEALDVAANMGIPAQNFVAGDSKGNIGWTIAGAMPRRAQPGPGSTFPLPADTQGAGWQGLLAPQAHPIVRNPAAGQLATANSRQLIGAGAELLGDGGFDLGARTHQVRDGLTALGPKTDESGLYGVALDDRAIFIGTWRERALAVLDAQAVAGNAPRAEALRLLRTSWNGHAGVDSVAYRFARGYMWSLYELVYGGVNGELGQLSKGANMASATSRWPVVLARLLDERPAGWLPGRYASWKELELAAIDLTITDLTRGGKPLAAATWGERNTQEIAHPISAAVPALQRWLAAPADRLPGDSHMPRVAGRKFGQSERLVVSPGREDQGIFNMPGGQSGHPLSPYFLAGHQDWVAGKATPLLPGPSRHMLTFVK
ncbi:MAG: penicillin acylase family protein [Pseudomonadota bacterium]